MRLNLEQNKECLISLSRFKFSLVINGFTDILKTIDNTVGLIHFSHLDFSCVFFSPPIEIRRRI